VVFLQMKESYDQSMATNSSTKPLAFDCPALYHIVVRGRIDPSWSDRLEGMAIHSILSTDGHPVTTLEGELTDQAALAGVLNSLYELHLSVFVVMRLNVCS
jgi:hypothetical protein